MNPKNQQAAGQSLEEQRRQNPTRNELRMNCVNGAQLISHFRDRYGASIATLLDGVSASEEFIRDPANWLNNYDTYKLYYNCHHSAPGFTHKQWVEAGQEIYRNNASSYFKIIARLLPLKTIYHRVPEFNRRLSSLSRYTIVERGKGRVKYKYELLIPEVRQLYSIGCECYWHTGILKAIPKVHNPNSAFSNVKHDYCSLKLDHIFRECYKIESPRCGYTPEGFNLDGRLVAEWIVLEPPDSGSNCLSSHYRPCSRADANALAIRTDVFHRGTKIMSAGEIYNAPYCLFSVAYRQENILKRIFATPKISSQVIEAQLIKTETKFREAEAARLKEKDARRQLQKAHRELNDYYERLEDLVNARTRELAATQAKLIETEKSAVEHRIAGGFAHEMRNALAGAQLEFHSTLNFRNQNRSCPDLLNGAATRLLENIAALHDEFGIPAEKIGTLLLPDLRNIADIAEHLETALHGVAEDIQRGLNITSQIHEYAQLSELKTGTADVDIARLLRQMGKRLANQFAPADIRYSFKGPQKVILRGDEIHYNTIFTNLILNAKDALTEDQSALRDVPGEIAVAVETENGTSARVVVTIIDNGPGIPPERLGEIFEPFYSTKPTTGKGLGLSIVKKWVGLYDGQVGVASRVGHGTTFTVTLPGNGSNDGRLPDTRPKI